MTMLVFSIWRLVKTSYKKWLEQRGVPNSYQVTVANLRGKAASVNLLDPEARTEFVKKLCAEGINILIVDPIGPILRVNGIDEKDNVRVGQLLDAFNSLREVTPLRDILIVHHGGHDVANQKNRPGISRGASAWNDIPDALVVLLQTR
jgi:RecA-family ATPase